MNIMRRRLVGSSIIMAIVTILIVLTGCDTAYYKTMEKLGHHKRDIMVNRVESARDAQEEAKEQFESALEKFSSVVAVPDGDLKSQYDQLKTEYDKSSARAQTVNDRVDAVEEVSEDLFSEWEKELNEYTNAKLRRSSEIKLQKTRRQYDQLIKDQVLFLKHNLNAQAIASLQDELTTIESDVAKLIREMDASIREADTFISAMVDEG